MRSSALTRSGLIGLAGLLLVLQVALYPSGDPTVSSMAEMWRVRHTGPGGIGPGALEPRPARPEQMLGIPTGLRGPAWFGPLVSPPKLPRRQPVQWPAPEKQ